MKSTVYDALVTKSAELNGLVAKLASEGRPATDEEKAQLTVLKTDIDTIKSEWEANGRKAFLAGLDRTEPKTGLVLKSTEKFADVFKSEFDSESEGLSLDRMIRGVATGQWNGAELERKTAMSTAVASQGGFLVPDVLSTRVIDLARNKSYVVQAGAGTVPMTSMTLDMARLMSDPSVAWYPENGTIAETEMTFGRLSFNAHKLACVCRISSELLEDAGNTQGIIEGAIASAIALEIDRTAMFGTGVGQPLGIANTTSINTVTSIGTLASYDSWLTAVGDIRAYNFEPNATMMSPRTAMKLGKLKTGIASDETKLVPPGDYTDLQKFVTSQIPNTLGAGSDSASFVGRWDQLIIALRSEIRLELSNSADTAFLKDQVLIRATWRGDSKLSQPRSFSYLSGIS